MKNKILQFYSSIPSAVLAINAIDKALCEVGILTDNTLAGAVATCRVEVGKTFVPISENLNYSAQGLLKTFPTHFTQETALQYQHRPESIANIVYANRMGNGDVASGDGWKYAGKGLIQLTGRANYAHYGQEMGVDLIANPQAILDINNSAKVLALFFKERGVNLACDNKDWTKVRRLVNGGTNGLDVLLNVLNQYYS